MPNTEGLMPPWQPGQSGNPNGRPKSKPVRDALERVLSERGDDRKALDKAARAFLRRVAKGDVAAFKELADRLDGKVPQGHEGSDDGPPIRVEKIERVIIDSPNRDSEGVPPTS